MPRRYFTEWICLFVGIALVAAGIGVWLKVENDSLMATETARMDSLSKILVREISNNLQAVDRALAGVIRDRLTEMPAMHPDDVARRLRALVEAMPIIRGLMVMDAGGTVAMSIPSDLIGRNFAQRAYFAEPKETGVQAGMYLSPPFRSIRGDIVVNAARVVTDRTSGFQGVVTATMDPRYFSDVLHTALYAADLRASLSYGGGVKFVEAGPAPSVAPALRIDNLVARAGLHGTGAMVLTLQRSVSAVRAPVLWQAKVLYAVHAALAAIGAGALAWSQSRRRRARELDDERTYERAQADARASSETRFRTLIEEAPVAVAMLRHGVFIYANRRYKLLHGYGNGDDLSGLPWRAMIGKESLRSLSEQQSLIDADSPREQRFEAMGLAKHNQLVPVFKSTTRVELSDGPATLIFVQDISAQKLAEGFLLEARDAAEAANRSKADFLANMSHEIRTPLNAILGMAYLLERANRNRDARSMLQKIRRSGRSLLGIINDILDVSKIEAGAMTIDCSWFDLQDVIDNVAATMGVTAGEKEIDLLVHPLPPAVSRVLGDALRIEQLLTNLTSNAIKFTDRGRVELRVEVQGQAEDQLDVLFTVTDTGIGIAPAQQDSIFSPFTQADSSTTRRYGGSGLGLTICKRIVEMMHGAIGLRSVPGEGSAFWFSVPVRASTASSVPSSPEMVGLSLLSACEGEQATMLADMARQLRWHVSSAHAPEHLVAALAACPPGQAPAAIILPWSPGAPDTLASARAIRAMMPADACPIILLTSTFHAAEISAEATLGPVDAILTKPITASTLYNAVSEARRKRSLGETGPVGDGWDMPDGSELAGLRLLVVDDSEINRDVACRILSQEGAKVALAENGRVAIDFLLANPGAVDLVLMDVQMPVMDGIEATHILRSMPQFDSLPIIALTAGAFRAHQDAARDAGMTHFIAKPFDIPLTIDLIQRLTRPGDGKHGSPARVLDTEAGARIWGSLETYHCYLRKFRASFAATADTVRVLVAGQRTRDAAAALHALAGAAANVRLMPLSQLAARLESDVSAGTSSAVQLDELDGALKAALSDIDALAGPPAAAAPDSWEGGPIDPQAWPLLDALMLALQECRPEPPQQVLVALAPHVPAGLLAPIQACIDDFDWRGAARHAGTLAPRHQSFAEPTWND
jgi:PAS domain S-box-containing protein